MTKTRAEREEYYGGDVPELIQMCLECRRARCVDCLETMPAEEKRAIIEQRRKEEQELCSTKSLSRAD